MIPSIFLCCTNKKWTLRFPFYLGGSVTDLPEMDGISKWKMITGEERATDDFEILHNIDQNTMGVRKGPWKFIISELSSVLQYSKFYCTFCTNLHKSYHL